MQANGRDRPRHLRLQRPGADQDRPGRRRQGQPLGARLRRPDRGRHAVGELGSTVYSYGNSELRGGVTKLSPKQGVVDPERRRRLEPHRPHPDPGRPRRLGQRLPQRIGRGDRRPQHAAAGAAAGHQRRRRPRQGARLPARPGRLPGHPAGARHRAVQSQPARKRSSAPRDRSSSASRPRRSRGLVAIDDPLLPALRPRPLLARPVPVELDPVAVGIVEVERLADAVVGGAAERDPGLGQAAQRDRRGRARVG